MKRLELTITRTVDGEKYIHTQIRRRDFSDGRCVCIYEVKIEGRNEVDAYEVFIPRLQKKDIKMPTAGYVSPAGEKYPGTNDFGPRASYVSGLDSKTSTKLDRANAEFKEFCDRIEETIAAKQLKADRKLQKSIKKDVVIKKPTSKVVDKKQPKVKSKK